MLSAECAARRRCVSPGFLVNAVASYLISSDPARWVCDAEFNQSYLIRLVDEHQSGVRDHSMPLWTLLMFQATVRDDQFVVTGSL